MPRTKAHLTEDIRSMARSHSAMAIRVLAGIARSPKANTAARATACGMLLDRGWGKATQEVSSKNEITVIIRKLAELDAIEAAKPPGPVIEHDPTQLELFGPSGLADDSVTE